MKISIIIPTIGRKTLLQVLEEIKACNNFEKINPEILVVFDGTVGTDPCVCPQVLNQFNDENKNIKVFETKQKVYAAGARNLGIKQATGDILVFMGDDTIPEKNWLQKIYDFHIQFPDKKMGLLGKVLWTKELAADPFHRFLETGPQFNFPQIEKQGPDWHHFYTSNISIKKELVGNDLFSDQFKGWGFEDIEFGYRLYKKGLNLVFDSTCEVFHDDRQTLAGLIKRTQAAAQNAQIFETLHPEVSIRPQGIKLGILKLAIFLTYLPSLFSKKIKWWRLWKQVWI